MDILSHGLWAGAAAGAIARRRQVTRGQVAAFVALGMLPDVWQLLPVVAWSATQSQPLHAIGAFVAATPGHEPAIPPVVHFLSHHLHCIFHSAVVLAAVTLLVRRFHPSALVVLAGWWLHVLLDIPTHSSDYYAVPFLYPFTYWGVDGIPWTTPWVLAANYGALAAAYAWLVIAARRSSAAARCPPPTPSSGSSRAPRSSD